MKKYLTYITSLVGCVFMLTSCDDFLDVQPEDKFLEEDIYSKENSIQTVLNGIYTNLTNASTYGGNLTMSTVEVFGQQFDLSEEDHEWKQFGNYNYEDSGVQSSINAIWTNTYDNILNVNNFITGIDTYENPLSVEKKNILKGEAFALRAMLHFDMLRLFGPVYSEFPNRVSIPYNTEATADLSPLFSASVVIDYILQDLKTAEELLANDPIIEYGKISVNQEDAYDLEEGDAGYGFQGTDFYRYRNLRLNYYAVKALQARVNLYAGNNTDALAAAKVVIEQASQWFPWTPYNEVIGENPDRIFSSEVLFGIQNYNINARYNSFYNDEVILTKILSAHPVQLEIAFEANQNDYRFNSTWIVPSSGSKSFRTFYKYYNITSEEQFMQPLIKMSEMYYIAAETEPDPEVAIQYLNTVRYNRGLVDLDSSVDIESEITKEYKKEFYGEGQLFFYYKRKNMTSIPNGSSSNDVLDMNSTTYVVPLPLSKPITVTIKS